MADPGNGLMPSSWGPAFWHVLYVFAANYKLHPTCTDKVDAALFLRSISRALPCRKCRENFPINATEANLDINVFAGREELFSFVYRLHTSVSRALGKELSFTCDEARKVIELSRATCSTNPNTHAGCQTPAKGTLTPRLRMTLTDGNPSLERKASETTSEKRQ